MANKRPATGLANKTATPAATPAQINSRLYLKAENPLLYDSLPIVAVATTVETSTPVDPPNMTVKKPLIKCEGILKNGK